MQWLFRLLGIDEDSLRELRIEDFRTKMIDANTRAERLYWWREMNREILLRSPEQVKRMERKQGLA